MERHPFKPFVPQGARYLILGSFPGRVSTHLRMREGQGKEYKDDWFYASGKNLFWPLLEKIFVMSLKSREEKEKLLERLKIAITDIILVCERKYNTNLDSHLKNKEYNTKAIQKILTQNSIEKIIFTGKGVYNEYIKKIQTIIEAHKGQFIILPSPSPAANRSIARTKEYNHLKEKNIVKDPFDYRLYKWREVFSIL